jgi:hypothetical protein
MLSTADYERVRNAILSATPIALKSSSYTSAHRDYIDRVLSLYLYELGLVHLHNNLAYCVHELARNARNALLKRIYFSERDLDINDRSEYARGMRSFRHDTIAEKHRYLESLEDSSYYIRFVFRHDPETVSIAIENNTTLLPIEWERIAEKLENARRYRTMADAYAALADFSEGAGLGIAMVVVMLRTLGLPANSLSIGNGASEDETTRATISIKRSTVGRYQDATYQ